MRLGEIDDSESRLLTYHKVEVTQTLPHVTMRDNHLTKGASLTGSYFFRSPSREIIPFHTFNAAKQLIKLFYKLKKLLGYYR